VSRDRYLSREVTLGVVAAGILLLIIALPDLSPPLSGNAPVGAARGRIVEFLERGPVDPDNPEAGFGGDVVVEIVDGSRAGTRVEAYLEGPSGQLDLPDYAVGDEVVLTFTDQPEGAEFVAVSDRWRLPALGLLALAFAVAIAVVGGARGLRALLALGLTIALVLKVVVPLVLQGVAPIPLAVGVAGLVTVLTIGLTEGASRTSAAAIVGTLSALTITGALAAATTALGNFTNAAGTELVYLETAGGQSLDLRGLLLAAFIFGALGVIDDVTVTQAAAVTELSERGGLYGRRLFVSALNVGRSHIAATVNTLFLAYVGASLPLLVLFAVSQQPAALVLNGEVVAIEIVRGLVGGLGIAAAVPFTTAAAVALAEPRLRRSARRRGRIGV
jgi:uncharacterized membrane protein